jgi:hypothetical protein
MTRPITTAPTMGIAPCRVLNHARTAVETVVTRLFTPDHRHQIWARTRDALATVPHHSVVLTHDTTRSRELLATQAMVGKVGLETS